MESIIEDPDIILRKQLDRVKDQKMAEMKMEGIEYDKRMEELEKLRISRSRTASSFIPPSTPLPTDIRGWARRTSGRNPSRGRCLNRSARSADYIRDYELQRAEGVLLRHLNRVFKVLTQNVPDAAKNDQVREMELYLGAMIRQVDSSLLDEWEKMRDPNYQRAETKEVRPPGAEEAAQDITRDTKAFTAAIRNRIFVFLRGLVIGDYEAAIANLSADAGTADLPSRLRRAAARPADAEGILDGGPFAAAVEAYHVGHEHICLDPEARNARHTYVVPSEDKKTWRVQQMLVDPEGDNDWVAEFEVDLAQSRASGEPFLQLAAHRQSGLSNP